MHSRIAPRNRRDRLFTGFESVKATEGNEGNEGRSVQTLRFLCYLLFLGWRMHSRIAPRNRRDRLFTGFKYSQGNKRKRRWSVQTLRFLCYLLFSGCSRALSHCAAATAGIAFSLGLNPVKATEGNEITKVVFPNPSLPWLPSVLPQRRNIFRPEQIHRR
jgi:hypothetical protein